jgi:hypothetical protein
MYHFQQTRAWQLSKLLQTADCMCSLGYWIPSEVVLTVKGSKGDSNIEEALKAAGVEPAKVIHVGQNKVAGETVLAKASAADAKAKKNSCKVICDGNHKGLARWLAKEIGGVDLTPIEAEVEPALAERVAREANLALQTAAGLANEEKLASIVHLRKLGVYKAQKDLPFGGNDRGNHQNYWWRSEAVVNAGYAIEQVAKLKWQVAKRLCEGIKYEEAILEAAKKNEDKVVNAESIKRAAIIAANADPESKDPMTPILKAAAAGDNDGFKQLVAKRYAVKE